VVHEGPAPVACADYLRRAAAEPKIRFHADARVAEVLGNETGMTGVRLRGTQGQDPGQTAGITAMGLFALPGLEPQSAIAPPQVERDGENFLKVDDALETAVPGLWAIGQVRAGFPGWLADAVADARRVAAQVKARLAA